MVSVFVQAFTNVYHMGATFYYMQWAKFKDGTIAPRTSLIHQCTCMWKPLPGWKIMQHIMGIVCLITKMSCCQITNQGKLTSTKSTSLRWWTKWRDLCANPHSWRYAWEHHMKHLKIKKVSLYIYIVDRTLLVSVDFLSPFSSRSSACIWKMLYMYIVTIFISLRMIVSLD